MPRRRLDTELVRRGLVSTRSQARRRIEAGEVLVSGSFATKSGRLVAPDEAIRFDAPPPRFVSRAGEKLDAALEQFGLDPSGLTVLDAGASTGGFTDCLLQRGAERVFAVDVGYGQLHERVRSNARVDVHERQNVREIDPSLLGGLAHWGVADLSFISLRTVLPVLFDCIRPGGTFVFLVKPQFEAGKTEADRGRGIISDPAVWRRVLGEVNDALADLGATMIGGMVSPLRGGDGNVEFLVAGRAPSQGSGRALPTDELDALVAGVDPLD